MTNKLRPTKLIDIVGQQTIKDRLDIVIKAAKSRQCSVPHILFYGPPGTGKSTLSLAVANEIGSTLHSVNAGNISSVKDILPAIFKIDKNDVLFIDEIHRLNVKTCEMLYTVMEDFTFCNVADGDVMSIDIPRFTMIGATTEAGSLPKPMLDRFTYKMELKLYDEQDLSKIIEWSADKMDIGIESNAALNLAKRSRGTPRIANHLITWLRDYVQSKGSSFVSEAIVDDALVLAGIDKNGVTEADRTYINSLKKFNRPVGIRTIIDATSIDEETIVNIIEPFLIRSGIIERTPKGRKLCR